MKSFMKRRAISKHHYYFQWHCLTNLLDDICVESLQQAVAWDYFSLASQYLVSYQ